MKSPVKKDKDYILKKKFHFDPDFKDPLVVKSSDAFDEIEVEEANYYFNIHLGIPVKHDES